MLEKLIDLFVGKVVMITHTNPEIRTIEGVCKAIHAVPGNDICFEVEIENQNRFRFMPEVITENSTDGNLPAWMWGRRKVEVIPPRETNLTDDPELNIRLAEHGITEAAINLRLADIKTCNWSSNEDTQLKKAAARYLCSTTEELSQYGATITWK
jgi:hypothetical protein